jgi:sialic acid synthase SpsE
MVPEEAEVARRESIRAARDLVEGEVIAPCDVVLQRPGIGVRPRFLGVMVGHQLRRSIPKGGIIEWNNLEPAGEIK